MAIYAKKFIVSTEKHIHSCFNILIYSCLKIFAVFCIYTPDYRFSILANDF